LPALDNIFVPGGAACVRDRTRAKGSNVVGDGATLMATSVMTNRMNGNLQCKENIPARPGSGNRAASKEDQCARL
jgi:hypothetical protein